ncbi:MAG: ferredoxin family protein [Bacteroidales bacterium]|jgi:2-oxoglutarate ferredoxin oxidoreductase subunit delta|nr:ferredoxin family protein [Bacteroidales bacterium]
MAKIKGFVELNIEHCKGCELCVDACPFDVLEMSAQVNGKGYTYPFMKNPEQCTGCASCALVCPDVVITVYKVPTKQ